MADRTPLSGLERYLQSKKVSVSLSPTAVVFPGAIVRHPLKPEGTKRARRLVTVRVGTEFVVR